MNDLFKFLGSKAFLFCVAIVTFLIVMTGCSAINTIGNQSADKIAPLVDKYCAEINEESRAKLRQKINDRTNGNVIEIRCRNDNTETQARLSERSDNTHAFVVRHVDRLYQHEQHTDRNQNNTAIYATHGVAENSAAKSYRRYRF